MHRTCLILVFTVCTFFSLQTGPVCAKDVPFIVKMTLPALKARIENNRGKVIILDFWLAG